MRSIAGLAAAGLLVGCATVDGGPAGCDLTDGALDSAAFVIATAPDAGARVRSGFGSSGCSRDLREHRRLAPHRRDGGVLAQDIQPAAASTGLALSPSMFRSA